MANARRDAMAANLDLIDTKAIGKPPPFDGEETRWREWSYVFKAYLGMMDSGMTPLLAASETSTEAIQLEQMGPTTQDRSQTLQYVLILMTRNRALRIVRLAGGSRNGFEAWRKLTAWYEPHEAGRQVGLLSQILNPSYRSTTLKDWEEDYFKWRELVEKYDSVETQALQDNIKISIVLKHAPEQIRQQL